MLILSVMSFLSDNSSGGVGHQDSEAGSGYFSVFPKVICPHSLMINLDVCLRWVEMNQKHDLVFLKFLQWAKPTLPHHPFPFRLWPLG